MRALSAAVLLTLCSLAVPAASEDAIPLRNWVAPPWPKSPGLAPLASYAPSIFIAITPCRVADTRAGSGFPGAYGPPALAGGTTRDFPLGSQCGLPFGELLAVSLNLTVTNTQGPGDLRIFPKGGSVPLVSTLNYVAGQTIANAAVVPSGITGVNTSAITVQADVSGTDLIIDVNGYFANSLYSVLSATFAGSTTDRGLFDVYNYGTAAGIIGTTYLTTIGITAIPAGVLGIAGPVPSFVPAGDVSGVVGVASQTGSTNIGVLGLGSSRGVVGRNIDNAGAVQTSGVLGYTGTNGVYSFQDIGAAGTKNFIEPHATDPSLVIKYTALEGPEAGTYFRGRGRFVDRRALIEVPEDFRMVTDEGDLSIQVTPIGDFALVSVTRIGLDAIELKSTRDVAFFFTVNGVRKAFKDRRPIVAEPFYFVPSSPNDRLEAVYNEEFRRRLVENGTFNPDGSVNMETAERLGWARAWREGTAPR